MPSCEKCWGDAYMMTLSEPMKSQAEHYSDLIIKRKDIPCTPEEQAGINAKICPSCNMRAIHEIVNMCMNCGYSVVNK